MAKYDAKYVGTEGATPSEWTKVGKVAVNEFDSSNLPVGYIPGILESFDTSGYVIVSDTTTAGLVGRSTGGGIGTASEDTPTWWVTSAKTDESFLNLAKKLTGSQSLSTGPTAKTLLNSLGYWTSYSGVSSGSIVAHYSLRQLSGYSGDAIRVRRSSDNTSQNIGFSSGELDTTSLLSFVGSGDGFVDIWYDQSGLGNHLTQPVATVQPQIVFSGVVQTFGGKNCIYFDGNDDRLVENTTFFDFSTNGRFSIFSVFSPTVLDGRTHVYVHADRFTPRMTQVRINSSPGSGTSEFISFSGISAEFDTDTTSISTNTKYVTSAIRRQTEIEIYTNGLSNGPNSSASIGNNRDSNQNLEVGRRLTVSEAFEGNIFEVSIYNDAVNNSTRQNIEQEITSHYGI